MKQVLRTKRAGAFAFGSLQSLCCKIAFSITFILYIGLSSGSAQRVPSCNLSGPLEASAQAGNIIVLVEVANSTANPSFNYQFSSNSSGAVIVEKSPIAYNKAKNSATQRVTISPGSQGKEFNLQLMVTTLGGSSRCSKSVSVTQ